jgi:hypothetical protein
MKHLCGARYARISACLLLLFVAGNYGYAQESSPSEKKTEESKKSSAPSPQPDQNQVSNEITAVPNRPTFSTTAESVQRGVLEAEYGVELADGHQNINGLIKWGLSKNLELRFGNNPFERDAGAAGLGDSGAGFKYKLVSEAGGLPTFSVLYTASFPTSTGAPGIGATGHSVDILVSKDFGKHHLDFNEGAHFLGRPGTGGYDRTYFTALSYAYALTRNWGLTSEIAGFSKANAGLPASMTLLLAATYNVSSRLVLDGGEYTAAYGNLPRVTFFTGVTYSIADLYHFHRSGRSANRKP